MNVVIDSSVKFWKLYLGHFPRFLRLRCDDDWSWPLIGREWSHELNTGLSLVTGMTMMDSCYRGKILGPCEAGTAVSHSPSCHSFSLIIKIFAEKYICAWWTRVQIFQQPPLSDDLAMWAQSHDEPVATQLQSYILWLNVWTSWRNEMAARY